MIDYLVLFSYIAWPPWLFSLILCCFSLSYVTLSASLRFHHVITSCSKITPPHLLRPFLYKSLFFCVYNFLCNCSSLKTDTSRGESEWINITQKKKTGGLESTITNTCYLTSINPCFNSNSLKLIQIKLQIFTLWTIRRRRWPLYNILLSTRKRFILQIDFK